MPMRKPAKPAARGPAKAEAVTVRSGMTVEVIVSRGDVTLRAEATIEETLTVGRALVLLVREMAHQHPDLLPTVDTVPGGMLVSPDEVEYGYRTRKPPVGFTKEPI